MTRAKWKGRVVIAKVISALTIVNALMILLRTTDVLPKTTSMISAYSERPVLLPTLNSIDSVLLLIAGIALWRMSRLAFRFFLLEFGIGAAAAIYFAFYAPSAQILMLRHKHGDVFIVVLFGFALMIEALRCAFAWWITSE